MRAYLRRFLRQFARRFPGLRRFHGKLGLGRWLSAGAGPERLQFDGDIAIEADLGQPYFRSLYFTHDAAAAEEIVIYRSLLGPADVVVDVGANIGYFALVAAKYAAHVHAFEPSPRTLVHFQRNLELNPRLAPKITVHPVGLSDRPGTLELYRPEQWPGSASLRPPAQPDAVVEVVAVDTLDRRLAGQPINFLKVDVEGAELDVLSGGRDLIARNRPLALVELNVEAQARFGRECQALVAFFEGLDYRAFEVRADPAHRGRLAVRPLDASRLGPGALVNGLLVPAAHAGDVLRRLPC